ncbi:hypothetical protein MRX96_052047 [Rhipicephalus microplus]
MSFGLFEEELRERFVRRILGALAATSLLAARISSSGGVTSVALRNFRAGVGAMGVGASGPSDEVFGGRPRGRLVAAASLEGPAAFWLAAVDVPLARPLAERRWPPPLPAPLRRHSGTLPRLSRRT